MSKRKREDTFINDSSTDEESTEDDSTDDDFFNEDILNDNDLSSSDEEDESKIEYDSSDEDNSSSDEDNSSSDEDYFFEEENILSKNQKIKSTNKNFSKKTSREYRAAKRYHNIKNGFKHNEIVELDDYNDSSKLIMDNNINELSKLELSSYLKNKILSELSDKNFKIKLLKY